MPRRIAILGSTGSVGCNTLEVVEHLGPEQYTVVALTTHNRCDQLLEQARKHRPAVVGVTSAKPTGAMRAELKSLGVEMIHAVDAAEQIARRDDSDFVLSALLGSAGLPAALASVGRGVPLALANKESLVVAGSLLMPLARSRRVPILPVDSEHSAIFQCLLAGTHAEIERVIVTASGGPFRSTPRDQMFAATADDALRHPTWKMGSKITIDSATMFNKALELIEASWMFDLPAEKLQVVIHPQSVVHSMVEFVDGSTMAQLGPPDMRTVIQYSLTWPARRPGIGRRLDLTRPQSLDFEPPDTDKFESLAMGFDAVRRRGTVGCVLNAANEVAVHALLQQRIRVGDIFEVVRRTIDGHRYEQSPSLDDLFELDRWARRYAERCIGN